MIQSYLQHITQPQPDSHKGENGKTLIIGGSDLFHTASQWSFQVVSRIVDMTFYSSVAENNAIIQEAKYFVQDGVVVKRSDLPNYLKEVDSVLLGPGMRRDWRTRFSLGKMPQLAWKDLTELDWEFDTQAVTSVLLAHFPQKKWVIDAGALQVLRPSWLPPQSILTPHQKEFSDLLSKLASSENDHNTQPSSSQYSSLSQLPLSTLPTKLKQLQTDLGQQAFAHEESLQPVVIREADLTPILTPNLVVHLKTIAQHLNQAHLILKGQADLIWNEEEVVAVVGGNAGLTKGGSGDALAGLIAGLVATSPRIPALVVSSYLIKLAAHQLYQQRRLMFNTSDVVEQIPVSWNALITPSAE